MISQRDRNATVDIRGGQLIPQRDSSGISSMSQRAPPRAIIGLQQAPPPGPSHESSTGRRLDRPCLRWENTAVANGSWDVEVDLFELFGRSFLDYAAARNPEIRDFSFWPLASPFLELACPEVQ